MKSKSDYFHESFTQSINRSKRKMNTKLLQSIPASQFKPRFDTTTLDGKIAVMEEAKKLGYVYLTAHILWHYRPVTHSSWDWVRFDYNFPTEPKTKLIPFTRDTFPREAWVRSLHGSDGARDIQWRVLAIDSLTFATRSEWHNFETAVSDFEISLDSGKTWQPCGQVVEE